MLTPARLIRFVAGLSLVAALALIGSSADAGHIHHGKHVGVHVHAGHGHVHPHHIHVHRNFVPYAGYRAYRPVVVGYYGPAYPIYPTYPVYPVYPTCYR